MSLTTRACRPALCRSGRSSRRLTASWSTNTPQAKPCTTARRHPMTMTAERNAEAQAVECDIATIDQALDHLRRVTADTRMRYGNARDAAADLAASVYYF